MLRLARHLTSPPTPPRLRRTSNPLLAKERGGIEIVEEVATTTEPVIEIVEDVATTTEPVIEIVEEVATTTPEIIILPTTDIEVAGGELNLPENLSQPIVVNSLEMVIQEASATSSRVEENSKYIYKDAFTNTDLEYQIIEKGVKEFIVLKSAGHPGEFKYKLNLDQFDAVQTNSSTIEIYKKGKSGQELFKLYTLSAPVMWDSAGSENSDLQFILEDSTLTLVPNAEWLSTAIYPVIIDPTIEINVLNVHSHPVEGEYWNVDFTTLGTADLTITPADQATVDEDEFTSLTCGGEDRTANAQILAGDVIYYPNWNCDDVATVSHLTLVTGNHHLLFQFANEEETVTDEAFNGARYWVGGCSTTNWTCDDAGTTNWAASSGGANTAAVPTSADDVFFDGNSGTGDSTISASITIESLDMTGYTGTLTHNASVTLTVDGNGVNFKMASSMTYTLGDAATSALSFTNTSGNTLITTNGKTTGNVGFTGTGGTRTLQDALTSSGIITLTSGTLDTNSQTVSAVAFSSAGSSTRTITFGSSAITITTPNNAWVTTSTNLTITSNTAVITFTGNGALFSHTSGATDFNGMSITYAHPSSGATTRLLATGSTFANVTYTGTAAKTNIFQMQGDVVITGTLTINGNSSTNRVLVASNTLGTARTFTAANVSVTNADFRDITGAGAGSWNLSAITGGSGDAGGNSGITFTTGQTNYWVGGTGSWSSSSEWANSSGGAGDSGRVPLPQDDVVFDANSFSAGGQTVTQDMARIGKNVDFSTVGSDNPILTVSASSSIYGSLILASGMTSTNINFTLTFEGRSAYTLTSAGVHVYFGIIVSMFGGSLTLQDSLPGSRGLNITNGTFDANNFDVTRDTLTSTGTLTRVINMGSGTWTFGQTGTIVSMAATGLTLNPGTSTITLTGTSGTTKTFAGAGLTFYNLTLPNDFVTITGSNTFNNLTVNMAGGVNGLRLTSGTTQTINGIFSSNGSSGSLVKLVSTTGGSAATISKSSGIVSEDYMSIQDITATGGASWYAGANSTNVSGNTGWTFTAPPTTTLADGTDPSNSTVAPGASITDLDSFVLSTDAGSDSVTALTVTLASGTYAGLSEVRITSSDGSTTYFSAASDPSSETVNFSGGTPIPVSTSATTFKIRITPKSHANMAVVPGSSYTTTGTVTTFTSTNSQSGTDTDSATITVDNTSPAVVTGASGTSGDASVALSWTNPVDADFDEVVVLRDTSAVADTPVEGTNYSVSGVIGSATVVCVTGSTSCTDSTASNGTAYHYSIFAQDSNGNYSSTGVVPTGSPFTPVASVSPSPSPTPTPSRKSMGERFHPSHFLLTMPLSSTTPITLTPITLPLPVPAPTPTFEPKATVTILKPVPTLPPTPISFEPLTVKPLSSPTPNPIITFVSKIAFPKVASPLPFIKRLSRSIGSSTSVLTQNFINDLERGQDLVVSINNPTLNQLEKSLLRSIVSIKSPQLALDSPTPTPTPEPTPQPTPQPTPEQQSLPPQGQLVFESGELELIADQTKPIQAITGFNFKLKLRPRRAASDIEVASVDGTYKFSGPDDSGIWSADVAMPEVPGQFTINTKIAYADGTDRDIDQTVLIDPEGYVYEKQARGELRIANAKVTLWRNDGDKWQIWPAGRYNQTNPQITDNSGQYSFLAPSGKYYLEAIAEGYRHYVSEVFDLSQASPIHNSIKLEYLGDTP